MTPESLNQSIHDLLEGLITDDHFDALQMELRINPDAREIYLDHVAFQNTLDIHSQGEDQMVLSSEIPLVMPKQPEPAISQEPETPTKNSGFFPLKTATVPVKPVAPIRNIHPISPSHSEKSSIIEGTTSRILTVLTWSSAAVIAISTLLFFGQSIKDLGSSNEGLFALSTSKDTPNSIAAIQPSSGSIVSLYQNNKNFLKKSISTYHQVFSGDRVQLKAGFVQINYSNGVRGIIEAPAEFTIKDTKNIQLPVGKGWFHVTKQGQGFTVTTSQTKNVDLGTKFGVLARKTLDDQLTVFEGSVQVSSLSKPQKEHTVYSGATLGCDTKGEFYKINKPSQYLSALPETPPYIHWSFDKLNGANYLPSQGPASYAKSTRAQWRSSTHSRNTKLLPGFHSKAISFRLQGEHMRTSWPGIKGDADRTVMLWLKLPNQFQSRILPVPPILSWGTPSNTKNSEWQLRLHPRQDGRYSPSISLGADQFHGLVNLPTGTWVHLTIVQDSSAKQPLTLYLNGTQQPIQSATPSAKRLAIDTIVDSEDSQTLSIGGSYHRSQIQTIPCQIDELYVFEGKVDASIIQHWMHKKAEQISVLP